MSQREPRVSYRTVTTAASSFHVSDTVDWSSQSAQAKNRAFAKSMVVRGPDLIQPVRSQRRPVEQDRKQHGEGHD